MIVSQHLPALRAVSLYRSLLKTFAVGMLTSLCAAPGYLAVSSLFAGKTAFSATSVHPNDAWRYSERAPIEDDVPLPPQARPAPPPMLAGPIDPGLGAVFASAQPVGFTIAPPPSDREPAVRPVLVGYRPLDEQVPR
jgi:hypothetical protein